MRIAQVRSVWTRVPDPLRPGQHARAEKVISAGASAISHPLGNFTVGDDGFFDVPPKVAADLLGRVFPGDERRWLTEPEVPNDVELAPPVKAGKQR